MEAMWPRYVPTYRELHRRLTSGDLGDVRLATSSVGWSVPDDPAHRLNRADLGGGVTLDMGVYALWFAQFAVGRVERVLATGTMRGGVDETIVVAIDAPSGRRASVTSTMSATTSGHGEIVGTSGRAVVTGNIVFPSGFDLVLGEKAVEWRDPMPLPFRDGLAWQAAALAGYVAAGMTDSPLHSLDDSIALADTMDAVLTQVRSSRIGVDER
jgi:predicted dehydrogenase